VLADAGCAEEAVELLRTMLIKAKAGSAHRAARLLGELGHREEATKLLFDFFKSATSLPVQRVREAVVLSELGHEREALEALREMLTTQASRGFAGLGLSYLGHNEEARDVFSQLAQDPELSVNDRTTVDSYNDYVAEKERGFNALHPLATLEMLGDVLGLDV
jgi:HEAT repeat protein